MGEIVPVSDAVSRRKALRGDNKKVVFTNGTFDILHRGHVEFLNKAQAMGDVLFVGLNSDDSVRSIKGQGRPVMSQDDRAYLLANLVCVNYVIIFNEDTPLELIGSLLPDILIKGADWPVEKIVGKEIVEQHGGTVVTVELTPGRSSTSVIETILRRTTYFHK
jgi:rfaE bifunctional protein nucleotidyltransferase chain/domain